MPWKLPFRFLTPLAGIIAGCLRPDVPQLGQTERGSIFMVPGIEGTTWQLRGTVRGLREAGIDQTIEIVEWGKHPFRQLYNLCAIEANRVVARGLARRIAACHAAHPHAPVTLIGYSGGGGIAVLTAESLPEQVTLDRLILIAAAVSPRYDLSRVFAHTRQGVTNFYSERDWLILGYGTRVFGTIDREKTSSAGRIGFRDAEGGLLESVQLTQIGWRPEWLELGHNGGHIGWLASAWAHDVLAPLIDASLTRPARQEAMAAP